ncbi:hypothetical protein BDD12DRAFT_885900 [Trichophaea hybrida]|nr:hypothetical protein BDD12DRAFT_885900 [Trichophaea hybrida]
MLHHILNSSGDNQARSIVTTFLSTLLHMILERDLRHFREEGSSAITVEKILNASLGGELLRALTETDENEKDISEFARSFLGPYLDLPPDILHQAMECILEKAQGVLPTELDAFYRDILRESENREEPDIKDGLRMFRIVLFTYHPLRLAELNHTLAIPDDPDAEFLIADVSFEGDMIHAIDKRLVHCGGSFLEIKGLDEYRSVQFVHHTVREFFLRYNNLATELEFKTRFRICDGDSHIRISIICFRNLMLCTANTSLEKELPSVDS